MENLRSLRESFGLSQQKLADKFELAQSQIQSYETGAYEPDIATLKAFADFFNTSIDYIVGHTDIRRKIEPVEEMTVNESEKDLVEIYRRMLPNKRKCLSMYLDALTEA